MFLWIPAQRHRPRTGVRRESRSGLVDPVLDAVIPLLDPLAEEPRPIGHVRVEHRGVDPRAGRRPRLDELLELQHAASAAVCSSDRPARRALAHAVAMSPMLLAVERVSTTTMFAPMICCAVVDATENVPESSVARLSTSMSLYPSRTACSYTSRQSP